jgi:HK97 family phage portal protein
MPPAFTVPLSWPRRWWEALREVLRPLAPPPGLLPPPPPLSGGLWWPGSGPSGSYAVLYRAQPHVRTVVDFLAQQLGQLGIQVFRRLSDTDRVRVHNHPLARLLRTPNPGTTRAVWVSALVHDLGVFGNAYAVKVRRPNRLELYRVTPATVQPLGDLVPRAFVWTLPDGTTFPLPASEVFHLRLYNPDDPVVGLSPLETLRKVLAEEAAANDFRTWFWANGAKLGGWIGRPKDAPKWTAEQREDFRQQWANFVGPRNAGKTAVLEDGMEFTPITASARDSELVDARKLTREEVAAAYHVPPAMVGIVEAQGYGSLREQHKALYQDTLGPLVALLEGELERQLLPEFSDSDEGEVYVQFNISEKLQGSFEEEQQALSAATGSPYMSRNEARARLNLPRINDAAFDVPVTRLDLAEGQAAALRPVEPAVPAASLPTRGGSEPPALDPSADRIIRALRALPRELAETLPAAAPGRSGRRAPRRILRDDRGRVRASEELGPDGTVIRREVFVRNAQGHVIEIAETAR